MRLQNQIPAEGGEDSEEGGVNSRNICTKLLSFS